MSDFTLLGTQIYENAYNVSGWDVKKLDEYFFSEGKKIIDAIEALNGLTDAKEIARKAMMWSNVCIDFGGNIRIFFDREAKLLSVVLTAKQISFDSDHLGMAERLCSSAAALYALPEGDCVSMIVKYR